MKIKEITKEKLEEVIKNSTSLAGVLKKLEITMDGWNYSEIKKKIKNFEISTEHFFGQSWRKNKVFGHKNSIEVYLNNEIKITSDKLKKRLIKEGYFEHKCYRCNKKEWEGEEIPIELHHKDGNSKNNNLENLTILCPNCHTQTKNHGSKNIKKHVDKDFMIEMIKESNSVSEVLEKCGLSTRGNNHNRVYRVMVEIGAQFKKTEKEQIEKIRKEKEYICAECGGKCGKGSNRCKSCYNNSRKKKILINRCKCGKKIKKCSKMCDQCRAFNMRKVERPPFEQLKKEVEDIGCCAVGRKYGVRRSTIKKWIKYYEKQIGLVEAQNDGVPESGLKEQSAKLLNS